MGISFCLLESNDGGERNLHATLYDESKQFIRPNIGFTYSRVAQTSWRRTDRVRGVRSNYEGDEYHRKRRKRLCPMLKLYPSMAGWASIERSDLMEMRLCLPARRSQGNQYWTLKRFWSASQMIDSKQYCGLITVSFASFSVYSFTPWMVALDTQTSNRPRAQNGPGHHNDDPTMVQKVRRET